MEKIVMWKIQSNFEQCIELVTINGHLNSVELEPEEKKPAVF